MRFLSRAAAALASAGALTALVAGPAAADSAVTPIAGSPLTVWIGDQGQLQAKRDADSANIFFAPSNQIGDAGFFLAFPDVPAAAPAPAQNATLKGHVFGFDGTAGPIIADDDQYVPVSQAPPTGSGTAADPFKQVTTYAVEAGAPATRFALVTQTTTYINGGLVFDVRWDVKNVTGAALRFKAIGAADFYFEGSDVGTGIYTQGPPRFIGGTNADTGRSGGFVEAAAPSPSLPWSHYQALAYTDPAGNDVWTRVEDAGDAATPSFADTVVGEPVDNAGAVEWDQYLDPAKTLAAGATASFELLVRTALPAALQFDQTNAGAPQGVPITFTVTAKDTADNPFAGKKLVSTITGANPGTQAAVIGTDGKATITDPGANAGPDTIVSFVDLNGNGVREANEPQGSALATFVDKTPPACKVTVAGDRPVGSGGQGKPLTITVNCDSVATVTTASTLTIQPATPKSAPKQAKKSASAAKAKPKHKKKKAKPKKPKKVVVKLAPATASVAPGQLLPLAVVVPASLNKKYPGATATATVTVTATDTAGNAATSTATQKVKLAKPKAKPKKKAKAKHKKKSKKRK